MDKQGTKLFINDIENKEEIFNVIVNELRGHGIKYRKEKRTRTGQEKIRCKRIFNVPLYTLELTDVILANGGVAQVPLFVSNACQRILEQVNTEGLFRKAGSSKRQQEIKASLETGKPLGKSYHVIDIANILKTFFRDLPEPILPTGNIQEALIRCLLSGEHKVYDLMITCLLLPPITLNTLAFFMQFLHTVSLHSNSNKMTIENLAIILTPNLMPIAEMIQQRLTSHVKVIQLLIENSHQIGVIPGPVLEKLNDTISGVRQSSDQHGTMMAQNMTDKKKKKRRSGSLTRMFHGLKKIVGAIGSSESLDKSDELIDTDTTVSIATPCLNKFNKKRKVADGMPFSAKKKKEVVSSLPDSQEILPYTPIAILKQAKKSRLSLGGNKNKSSKENSRLVPCSSVTSIIDNKPMERRWSVVGAPWARKKPNRNASKDQVQVGNITVEDNESDMGGLSPVVSLPNLNTPDVQHGCKLAQALRKPLLRGKTLFADDDVGNDDVNTKVDDIDEQEFLRIPKSEYEAIKERVSAIETRISQEFGMIISNVETSGSDAIDTINRVADKYQEILEHTEPIEASCSSTDQLAKRLSRELKIRRSAEQKVMRSPSARKIGSIRRRSRESVRLSRNQSWHLGPSTKPIITATSDLSFYPKTNLKRGRPNTVQSGLKHPEVSPVRRGKKSDEESPSYVQNITDEEKQEDKWTCAQRFFNNSGTSVQSSDTEGTTIELFKTPESKIDSRRAPIRSVDSSTNVTPHFVTRIDIGEIRTPMLPPEIPPRKTPMLPPKTPGRLNTVLLKTHLTPLQELQSGRASIARLRSQNAGMVMAKAKLFDGLITKSTTDKTTQLHSQNNRRQSSIFLQKHNPNISKNSTPPMNVSDKLQLRQLQKVKSSTTGGKSPQRSTPRKRACTKSPHGGINRREKLRLVGKSSATKVFHSPCVIRNLQDNSKKLLSVNSDISVCFSSNHNLGNTTPHIRKQFLRNSPRRLVKTPDGRENKLFHSSGRQQTPLKATPLSKLTLASSGAVSNADSRTRRESPRLLANSTKCQTSTKIV
ncbi:uncharacterized protein LOC131677908 [Topomyia yanbarensis]|uniref:uncharacterized protein LOC131677908 n=1 Tax=Topomyia yanbarensis TaxID=2498891 RepID=UPI00273AF4EC|nr:uncharacterized protein LOC131677908 [Topomyia yanbarensis]